MAEKSKSKRKIKRHGDIKKELEKRENQSQYQTLKN